MARQQVVERFAHSGISATRLRFVGSQSRERYYATWQEIDIGLDPFPYGGGITTCDALSMGVPVLTLRGETAVGRGGCSILSNLDLPELIASTPAQYLEAARALASDLPRLHALRDDLPQRLKNSPLGNGADFAREVEKALGGMWRKWCLERELGGGLAG